MNELIFLGTCSGTEPMVGMHQTSIVLNINDTIYYLDAGENCGYASYTMGLDPMKTRAVFISHTHIDHIGGFPHLLFLIDKIAWRDKTSLGENNNLDVYIPSSEIFAAIKTVGESDGAPLRFSVTEHGISDGELYRDDNIKIRALHNRHLGEDGSNGWHSFSFLIEAAGKRILYSGDIKELTEIDPLLEGGCDILIMESGHHKVSAILDYVATRKVGTLFFSHHGREIINNRAAMQKLVCEHKQNAYIASDGLRVEL